MDDDDGGEAAEGPSPQLHKGRILLGVALAATLLSLPTVFFSKAIVAGAFWLISFLAGFAGIQQMAQPLAIGHIKARWAVIAAFVPMLNAAAFLYFLVRSQGASHRPNQPAPARSAQQSSREGTGRRAAMPRAREAAEVSHLSAAPAPGYSISTLEAQRPMRALPLIKRAGLGDVAEHSAPGVSIPPAGKSGRQKSGRVMRTAKGEFGVMYAMYEGDRLKYLDMEDFAAAGMSVEAVHRVALENLGLVMNGNNPGLSLVSHGSFWGLAMGRDFAASLVLVDELWEGPLAQYIPNGAVVAMPARDTCAFCDAASSEGIAQLRIMADRVTRRGRGGLISNKLFMRKQGRWQAFDG